jgi:DsbC/DsbD-like thiol-disulfide interchange protein
MRSLHAIVDGGAGPAILQEAMLIFRGLCGVLFIIGAGPATAADLYASDWVDGLKSSARLIAAGSKDGVQQAGVEIKLAPGAITYWRNPGDAGAPPTLSFEGSSNLAQARASFPAPERLRENDGGEAFGYDRGLVLPVDIEPIDRAKPVSIALKLNYAVCEKICVPAQASLNLVLPPDGAGASPYAEPIAKAKATIPRIVAWDALAAKLSATSEKSWRLCLAPEAGLARDAFIEPPQAWWVDVKREAAGDCFSLTLMQKPADAALPVAARLTITGGQGPVETTVNLSAGAKL